MHAIETLKVVSVCVLLFATSAAAQDDPREILQKSQNAVSSIGEKIELRTQRDIINATKEAISEIKEISVYVASNNPRMDRVINQLKRVRADLNRIEGKAPEVFKLRRDGASDIGKVGDLIGFTMQSESDLIARSQDQLDAHRNSIRDADSKTRRRLEAKIRTLELEIEGAESRIEIWNKFHDRYRGLYQTLGDQSGVLEEFVFMVGQTNQRIDIVVRTAGLRLEAERILEELRALEELEELTVDLDALSNDFSQSLQAIASLEF